LTDKSIKKTNYKNNTKQDFFCFVFPQSLTPLTGVTPLKEEEHTREVARLFSGADITAASLQLATELIEAGRSA